MKRSKAVKNYLKYAYVVAKSDDEQEVFDKLFEFLIENRTEFDFMAEEMSINFDIDVEEIMARKNDMIIEIIKDYYSYIRYCMLTDDVNDMEETIIKLFDSKRFTYSYILFYFMDPDNEYVAKRIVETYCFYIEKGNDFIKQVDIYNISNPTIFLNEIDIMKKRIDVIDEIAEEFDKAFAKTTDELDKEADEVNGEEVQEEGLYEERYYQDLDGREDTMEKIDEISEKLMEILTKNYGDFYSEEMNSFLGYYISLIYPILLERKEGDYLSDRDRELLELLEAEDMPLEAILNYFYEDKYNMFAVIELISREYIASLGQEYDNRPGYENQDENQLLIKLDPMYIYYIPDEHKQNNKIEMHMENITLKIMETIIEKLKAENPDDYQRVIYIFLLTEDKYDKIFLEYDIEKEYINSFKMQMIRMFIRKFYEYINSQKVQTRDLQIGNQLNGIQINLKTFIENFHKYGEIYIDAYFKLSRMSSITRKGAIRAFPNNIRKRLIELDPNVLVDPIYYQALSVGNLFILLEEHGVDLTCKYLIEISIIKTNKCRELISELLIGLYNKIKNNEEKSDIDNVFLKYIEGNSYTLEDYTADLINAPLLLKEFLARYLDFMKQEEYPIPIDSIKNNDIFNEKIKTKIFPSENK